MKENRKTIETILMLSGYHNPEYQLHGRRVGRFAEILLCGAESYFPEISLTKEVQERIAACALLHDLGKNALPDQVLGHEGKLTKREQELFFTHTLRGEEMADTLSLLLDKEYVKCLKKICRFHHERYDGRGYPEKLCAEEIPFEAQIVGIADAFDYMVSSRIYKHAFSCAQAYDGIIHGECGIFSPRLIGCFLHVRPELERAVAELKE